MGPIEQQDRAPGLVWYKKGGRDIPRWVASKQARSAGFTPATVNLTGLMHDQERMLAHCATLQANMQRWLGTKGVAVARPFTGTVTSLLEFYETHPESGFQQLGAQTRRIYLIYIRRLQTVAGDRRVAQLTGIDVKRWFDAAAKPAEAGERPKLAAARMMIAVLKAALAFGEANRLAGCADLAGSVRAVRFTGLKPRGARPSAKQVRDLIAAAHAKGQASIALTTALQFETTARLWDVIGQWVPLAEPGLSDITSGRMKWVSGLRWEMIGADNVLRFTPSKTQKSTGRDVAVDLSLCPLVLLEFQHIPHEARVGPIVLDPSTGRPWEQRKYRKNFQRIAAGAGWPPEFWPRDIRAGGISEARDGGAAIDDAARLAGHTDPRTTARVYDRSVLEATRRVSAARVRFRSSEQG